MEQDHYNIVPKDAYKDVVFGLYAKEDINQIKKDSLLAVAHIDKEGNAVFESDLPYGKYYAKELATNTYYQLDKQEYDVDFAYENTSDPLIKLNVNNGDAINNKLITNKIRIIKKDADSNLNVGLAGVTFRLKYFGTTEKALDQDESDIPFIETNDHDETTEFVTNDKGEVDLPFALPYGYYMIYEITAPKGYSIATKTVTVKVTEQKIEPVECEVYNLKQTGGITITKYGDKADKQPLAGVKYEVRAKEDIVSYDGVTHHKKGDIIATLVTDQNGQASVKGLDLGKYEIQEVSTVDGYILDKTVTDCEITYQGQDVTVQKNQSFEFYNQSQRGGITITKYGDKADKKPLAGVIYKIKAKEDIVTPDGVTHYQKGQIVNTIVTAKNGQASISNLYLGKYELQEVMTVDGYVLDPTVTDVEIDYQGDDVSVQKNQSFEFYNESQRGGITVTKYSDRLDKKPLMGVKFKIKAKEDIRTEDGVTHYHASETIATLTTDQNGQASLNNSNFAHRF